MFAEIQSWLMYLNSATRLPLELNAQHHLQESRCARARNQTKAGGIEDSLTAAARRGVQRDIRGLKIRVVQNIESFSADFEPELFPKGKVAAHCYVEVQFARSANGIPAEISDARRKYEGASSSAAGE